MPRPRSRTLIVIGATVTLLLVAAAVPVVFLLRGRQTDDSFHRAVTAFAAAWGTGRPDQVAYAGPGGPLASAEVVRQENLITGGLASTPAHLPAAVDVLGTTGPTGPTGSTGTASMRLRWDLGQGITWQYDTSVPWVRSAGVWRVEWSPTVIHPRLTAGQVLERVRTPAARGRIVGAGGQVLVTERQVVDVGIQPGRTTDRRASASAVAAVAGVDPVALTDRVLAAAPGTFVDVITLREPDYDAVRGRLQPIPGAVFQRTMRSLAPTAGFARALLGTVGPATKEIVGSSNGRVQVGDITGLSGLQRRYDGQLAGTAGVTVQAVPATGSAPAGGASTGSPSAGASTTGASTTGATTTGATTTGATTSAAPAGTTPAAPVTLYTVPPRNGTDLSLTLDPATQEAAEAALANAPKPAALVAVRASTGQVLAVANGPASAAGYDRALIGQYPPGSTFKVATGFALLQAGVTPTTPVPCPATVSVDGRTFHNAESEVLGNGTPFHSDFANSCNTAFIGATTQRLTAAQLHDAAVALGYARPDELGVDAFMGQVPADASPTEHAADAIGQGQILTSPLVVASVTASVAAGHYSPPRLVLTGGSPAGTANGTADGTSPSAPAASPAAPTPLPPATVTALRALMAEVVTSGTGTALRGVPGGPVSGKTGTAEFGSANPPQTHAWFTGFQGDVAFAVVVEGGGFGGKVAAPIAADFLRRLAH